MDEELRPCPFCGYEYPELYNDGGKYPMVICSKCCKSWPSHLWNCRPIEDALRARNVLLEKNVLEYEEREASCCPEDFGFEDVITHLRAENERLKEENEKLRIVNDRLNDYIGYSPVPPLPEPPQNDSSK